MNAKKFWHWQLWAKGTQVSGDVWAIDPRDAASRALCSETPAGQLVGQAYGIPVDILREFPGNNASEFAYQSQDFTLKVQVA